MAHLNNNDNVHRLDTPLLTPAEAAQLLAVKSSWIYEAVRSGSLPCLRICRHIRFTRTMLDEWLRGKVGVGRRGTGCIGRRRCRPLRSVRSGVAGAAILTRSSTSVYDLAGRISGGVFLIPDIR
jgi:excisionase family DNA binding protein